MYRRIIKPILFSLNIEQAHRAVLVLLRFVGLLPGGRWLLGKCYAVKHPALEREVFGLRFPNPVGLAAGFDRNGEAFRELTALGFGFVEIGSLTPRPQPGNPRPRIFRLPKDNAIIHRTGLANRGLETAIRHLRRPHEGVIVGCNIGKNTATLPENAAGDYLRLFRNLYQYADYFTVNISCDNACREGASHTREHIMSILNPLFEFRRGQNQYRPVMLKISPDMSDEAIDEIAEILLSSPLDGIVATNGTHSREKLRTSRTTVEKIGSGRLSGAPLTRRTVEIVRRIHTRSGGTYPIIGVGGLMTAEDVKRMLDAGADLVQLYTSFIYNGPGIVKTVCRQLVAEAERKALEAEEAARAAEFARAAKPTRTEEPARTEETVRPDKSASQHEPVGLVKNALSGDPETPAPRQATSPAAETTSAEDTGSVSDPTVPTGTETPAARGASTDPAASPTARTSAATRSSADLSVPADRKPSADDASADTVSESETARKS